jgi:hypothetical protein
MIVIRIGVILMVVGAVTKNVEEFIVGGILLLLGLSSWFVEQAQKAEAERLGIKSKSSCPPHAYEAVLTKEGKRESLKCSKCSFIPKVESSD